MLVIFESLGVIISFIFLGYGLRKLGLIPERFFHFLEWVLYYILFPILIISALATSPLDEVDFTTLLVFMPLCQIFMGLLTVGLKPILKLNDKSFACYFQTTVRYNNFISLSLASFLYGELGFSFMNIASMALIPTANILSIAGFLIWGKVGSLSIKDFLKNFITNPLILSCIVGLLVNRFISEIAWTGLDDYKDAISFFSRGTLILSLLNVGAALKLTLLFKAGWKIISFSFFRLFLMPIIALILGAVFDIEPIILAIMVIGTSTPTATSGYILAKKMRGDYSLMAVLIVTTTILSFITMPIMLYWLR